MTFGIISKVIFVDIAALPRVDDSALFLRLAVNPLSKSVGVNRFDIAAELVSGHDRVGLQRLRSVIDHFESQ